MKAGVDDQPNSSHQVHRVVADQLKRVIVIEPHLVAQGLQIERPALAVSGIYLRCPGNVPESKRVMQEVRYRVFSVESLGEVITWKVDVQKVFARKLP